jgi:hypothetical protein
MTAMNQARRHADSEAQEARELILGMPDKHANLVLVLDAVREAVADATWADFSEVLEGLDVALVKLANVYATERAAA